MGVIYVSQYAEDIITMSVDEIKSLSASDKRELLMSLFTSDYTFELKRGGNKQFIEWFSEKYKNTIISGTKRFRKSFSAKSGGYVIGVVMKADSQKHYGELLDQFSDSKKWGDWKECKGSIPEQVFSEGDCGSKQFCKAFMPMYVITSSSKKTITPIFIADCTSLNIDTNRGGTGTVREMWFAHFIYKGAGRRIEGIELKGVAPIGTVEKVLIDFKNELKEQYIPPYGDEEGEEGGEGSEGDEGWSGGESGGEGGESGGEGSYQAGFGLPDFITKNQKWLMIGAIGLAIYFLATSKPKK